jgi:xanthine/uracil permease
MSVALASVIGIIFISSKRFRKLNFIYIIALILIVGLIILDLPLFHCENGLCNDFWTKNDIYD